MKCISEKQQITPFFDHARMKTMKELQISPITDFMQHYTRNWTEHV